VLLFLARNKQCGTTSELQKVDSLQIKESTFMRIVSNSKISRHDGFEIVFLSFGIKN